MKSPLSLLPESWGGPFMWFENERGNLELIRLAEVGEWVTRANDAIRAYLAEVQS